MGGVANLFASEITSEITKELLKMLFDIARKSCLCKSSAEQLSSTLEQLRPMVYEIKMAGVELTPYRQTQLNNLYKTLEEGIDVTHKVLASPRWNVYKNLQLSRKMDQIDKKVSSILKTMVPMHVLADVQHLRAETAERFDRLEGSARRLEQRLGAMRMGGGGAGEWVIEEAMKRVEQEEERWAADCGFVSFGVGLELGKKRVKEMVLTERDEFRVVSICGIGGSGKTTLAREFCKDDLVRSYFCDRILFLTVSQSPNVDHLRAKIWGYIMGNENLDCNYMIPQYNLQYEGRIRARTLVVLDDVWSLPVLEKLIFPGCKILVVSRFKFPSVTKATYEVELLTENEALSLFCHSAFGEKSMPLGSDENLVKQVVSECKGLPLALKVIGASLRDQSEMFWLGARSRLSRSEPVSEPHENKLLERMAVSVKFLSKKVRECFLDLGAFPEDRKIPLEILINMWVELHDIDGKEAFAILLELSDKNLLTLVKEERTGDMYSSCFEIFVTQHDVLRDLALHLSNQGLINERPRLLMPRREKELPKEWGRNLDQPFNAKIISIHTGEMNEMDWFRLDFPKAEVLILNFSSTEYFLPHFIDKMPRLRALIVINHGSSNAILKNHSIFTNLPNLRSLWLEKVTIPPISKASILKKLRKISLVLCKVKNILGQSVELPQLFPCLSELTIDHCDDLFELPSTICGMYSLESLSITNCHSLYRLPADLGKLKSLQILRLYACPTLKMLSPGICELARLKYLDIAQCVNLACLPESLGKLESLEKIDMSECSQIRNLPRSASSLQSLRRVVCDEEVSWSWRDMEKAMPNLHIQVTEKCFDMDWINE